MAPVSRRITAARLNEMRLDSGEEIVRFMRELQGRRVVPG
jgi:hypothetical protein